LLVLVAWWIANVAAHWKHYETGRAARRESNPTDFDVLEVKHRLQAIRYVFLLGAPLAVALAHAIAAIEIAVASVELYQRRDVSRAAYASS
jgi:hypothetical protein